MGKYRSGTIEIDVADVLDEISDDDLLDEVHTRKLSTSGEPTDREIMEEAHAALMRGKAAEARTILERILFPKWSSSRECEANYIKMFPVKHSQ